MSWHACTVQKRPLAETSPFGLRDLGQSFLCWPTQGAELMSKYGVNVPPGIPVFKLDEVKAAAEEMASPDGEVGGKLLQNHVSTIISPCEGLGKHG